MNHLFASKLLPSEKAVTEKVSAAKVEKTVRRLQLHCGSAEPRSQTVISRIEAVINKSVCKALTSSFYDKYGALQLYTQGMLNQDIKNNFIVLIAVQSPVISVIRLSKPDTSKKVFSNTVSGGRIVGANEKRSEVQQPSTSASTPLEHDCAYAAWIISHQVSNQSSEMPKLNGGHYGADAFGARCNISMHLTVDELLGHVPEMDQSTNILQCEQQQLSMSVVPVPRIVLRGSGEASPVHSAPTAMREVVLDSEKETMMEEKETMMEEKETRMEERMMTTKAATAAPAKRTVVPVEPTQLMGAPAVGRVTEEEAMKGCLLQCTHQSIETTCALVVMHYVVEQSVQRQTALRLGVSKQCGGERKNGGDRLLSPLPRSGEVKEPIFALNTRRRVRGRRTQS